MGTLYSLYSYLANNTVPFLVALNLEPTLIQCICIGLIIPIYLKLILKQCIRIKLIIIPVDRL